MIRLINFFRNRKIAKKLNRHIVSLKDQLKSFQCIVIDQIFLEYNNKLQGLKKYFQIVSKFDEVVLDIAKHNEAIEKLQKQFDEIIAVNSKDKILMSIDNYPFVKIDEFNQVALKINEYTLPDTFSQKNQYLRYMRDIGEIVDDYQKIVEQYSLIKDFEVISFSFGDEYIDQKMAEKALAPAREILNKLKVYGSKHYVIPFLDEKIIERHNEQYIKSHLSDELFDNINDRSLDEQQRRAILCDAKSNLTIAGAGAGKTLTICGKVKWLQKAGKAKEEEILLLSYSKASADDLAAKISRIGENLKVKTFHSFGLEVLNSVYGSKRAIEEQFKAYINKFFEEELSNNSYAANNIFRFFSLYLFSESVSDKKYSNEGEKFEDLKTSDYRTLKDRLQSLTNDRGNLETLRKEYVKSLEELVIANYLFANGIKYEYERAYEIDTSTPEKRQYTPDFYLTDYGIYLEHYGVNEQGRTPQYTAEEEQKYIEGIKWKRETHKNNNTVCIETYSYEFKNGAVFKKLHERLKEHKVEFQPLSQKEIQEALNTIYLGQEFNSLFNLIMTFLSLYKAQYPNSDGFEKLKSYSLGSQYNNERAELFLDICKVIYDYYIAAIRAENKIDFDDMILQAIAAFDKTNQYRYKYIIVDEFQDISQSRTQFLKKIIEHGDSKLFAVGDDWQAIYRFAGCDISIFLHFEGYFEDAKLNYITSTHRNSAELQSIVGPFITANPEQYVKHIQSSKHQENPVRIFYHNNKRASAFTKALQNISRINPKAEVLVLSRNKHDIDSIISDGIQVRDYKTISHPKFPNMSLTYKTVHGSKGLESDFVVLISGENAKNGFPNKMEDDRLLELVLGNKSSYEFAEERRLFYVALTRTRSVVFILSDKNRPSIFVKEIEARVNIENLDLSELVLGKVSLCPWCKSGKLILRNEKFFGCSNFPYCKYTINDLKAVKVNNRCPDCGDFLVIRNGKFGKFIGCNNYPRCNITRKLSEYNTEKSTVV